MSNFHADSLRSRRSDHLRGGGWWIFAIILAIVLALFGLALFADTVTWHILS